MITEIKYLWVGAGCFLMKMSINGKNYIAPYTVYGGVLSKNTAFRNIIDLHKSGQNDN